MIVPLLMGAHLGDLDVWTRAGQHLQEVDPKRFRELLSLVKLAVAIHRDPMSVPLPSGSCVPPDGDPSR